MPVVGEQRKMAINVHTHEMCTQVYAKAGEQYGGYKRLENTEQQAKMTDLYGKR